LLWTRDRASPIAREIVKSVDDAPKFVGAGTNRPGHGSREHNNMNMLLDPECGNCVSHKILLAFDENDNNPNDKSLDFEYGNGIEEDTQESIDNPLSNYRYANNGLDVSVDATTNNISEQDSTIALVQLDHRKEPFDSDREIYNSDMLAIDKSRKNDNTTANAAASIARNAHDARLTTTDDHKATNKIKYKVQMYRQERVSKVTALVTTRRPEANTKAEPTSAQPSEVYYQSNDNSVRVIITKASRESEKPCDSIRCTDADDEDNRSDFGCEDSDHDAETPEHDTGAYYGPNHDADSCGFAGSGNGGVGRRIGMHAATVQSIVARHVHRRVVTDVDNEDARANNIQHNDEYVSVCHNHAPDPHNATRDAAGICESCPERGCCRNTESPNSDNENNRDNAAHRTDSQAFAAIYGVARAAAYDDSATRHCIVRSNALNVVGKSDSRCVNSGNDSILKHESDNENEHDQATRRITADNESEIGHDPEPNENDNSNFGCCDDDSGELINDSDHAFRLNNINSANNEEEIRQCASDNAHDENNRGTITSNVACYNPDINEGSSNSIDNRYNATKTRVPAGRKSTNATPLSAVYVNSRFTNDVENRQSIEKTGTFKDVAKSTPGHNRTDDTSKPTTNALDEIEGLSGNELLSVHDNGLCEINEHALARECGNDTLRKIARLNKLMRLVSTARDEAESMYRLQKVCVASIYGCIGATKSELAALITSMVRSTLLRTGRYLIERHGCRLYYIDTDSLFVTNPSNRNMSAELNAIHPWTEIEMKRHDRVLFVRNKTYYYWNDGVLKYGQHVNGPPAWRDMINYIVSCDGLSTVDDFEVALTRWYLMVYARLCRATIRASGTSARNEAASYVAQDIKLKTHYGTLTPAAELHEYLARHYPTIANVYRQTIYYHYDGTDILRTTYRPLVDLVTSDSTTEKRESTSPDEQAVNALEDRLRRVNMFKFFYNVSKTVYNVAKFYIRRNNRPFEVTLNDHHARLVMLRTFLAVYDYLFIVKNSGDESHYRENGSSVARVVAFGVFFAEVRRALETSTQSEYEIGSAIERVIDNTARLIRDTARESSRNMHDDIRHVIARHRDSATRVQCLQLDRLNATCYNTDSDSDENDADIDSDDDRRTTNINANCG